MSAESNIKIRSLVVNLLLAVQFVEELVYGINKFNVNNLALKSKH